MKRDPTLFMPVACFRCALLPDWTALLVANWTHLRDKLGLCACAPKVPLSPCESSATELVLPDFRHVKCHFSGFSDSILRPQRQPASPTQTTRKRGERKFLDKWNKKDNGEPRDWLTYDSEEGVMSCKQCVAHVVDRKESFIVGLCSSWTILRNVSKCKATFGRQKSRLRF